MLNIIDNKMIVPNLHQMTIEAPEIASNIAAGQFVILRVTEDGERIPLTVSDWDAEKGTITLIYLAIGMTTQKLAGLNPGSKLPTVVGPLGNAMQIEKFGNVFCIGGCYGIGSIYPVVRALKEKGNTVLTIIEARSSYMLYWVEKLKAASDGVIVITRDGSLGLRGHIGSLPKIIGAWPSAVDRIIINGCNFLMMRGSQESRPLNIKTIVSLNTLMIDGTGMCGVCRVTVDSTTKFACVDGPHFDGHRVDWDELTQRRKAYLHEEVVPFLSSRPQP
jgi:ferredoxin--NADP+ reductase